MPGKARSVTNPTVFPIHKLGRVRLNTKIIIHCNNGYMNTSIYHETSHPCTAMDTLDKKMVRAT